jgi:hypothetical protein
MKAITIAVLVLAMMAASSGISLAGDNRCLGVITASWHPIFLFIVDDQDAIGSTCEIALPLPPNG